MALTFTFVPPVQTGDRVTSTQAAKVADGFNDRLRCNAGDSADRIVYYLYSLFTQIRNPDGTGFLFLPRSEFFHFFQNMRPTDGEWPVGEPGDIEGANLACIINAFVFGAGAPDLWSEDLRIADPDFGGVPLWFSGGVPTTPENTWELGKQQRGAITVNGLLASPTFKAAIEHYKIRTNNLSPHGNSYGGFMPVPVDMADCEDPTIPDYQLFFTNLITGEIRPYAGTCPEQADHVAAVIKTPRWYLVWLNNGLVDVLPINEWIEGPYSGGSAIKRNWGDHLPRVLNAFANDFRGTESERESQTSWLQYAFDRERFLTSQYHLAPNIGEQSGDELDAVYPTYEKACAPGTSLAAGTLLVHQQSGGTSHQYESGFVFASSFLRTSKLAAACVVEFWTGGTLIKSVTLTPDGSGNAPLLVTIEPAIEAPHLSVKLPDGATFLDNTGYIHVECTELMSYLPQHHDLYLVLRLASARTTPSNGLDGSGRDEAGANVLSDSYFNNGVILNTHFAPGPAGSAAEVNTNAVFDAARRLSQFVRILPRQGFRGYAVENGKSVCWFARYVSVLGVEVDQFEGIAPSAEPVASGELVPGKVYVVRGGTIDYDSQTIAQDATFTASNVLTFTGTGTVFVREGIIAAADPEGFTNEWMMGAQLKVYGHTEESLWKPDAYSDYFFWSERCHFYHGLVGYGNDLKRQFDYGQNISLAPETFTGWRYVHNTNRWECDELDADCKTARRSRYKSCRIYEPLPEIESAVEEIEDGARVVKLTFKGRFHHHDAAPESIDRNVNTWDRAELLANEATWPTGYRTLENALREYLILQDRGLHCMGGGYDSGLGHNLAQQGNSAFMRPTDNDVWGLPDNPNGACFPHFYFLKLFPKPYEDNNDRQDANDTPLWADWWAQADLYLRAMCEGFVDDATSRELACTLGVNSVFCYTFEALCFQSHGLKWLTPLGTEETALLDSNQVRTDAPEGFGQAPALSLAAECYNQVAGCLNLLNRVQIMLPQKFQTQQISGTASANVAASWPSPAPACQTNGSPIGYYRGTPPDAAATTVDSWVDSTVVQSIVGASIDNNICSGSSWVLSTSRSDSRWRWALVDPDAYYALPEVWQSVFTDDGGEKVTLIGALIGIRTIFDERRRARNVTNIADASHCLLQTGYWVDPGGGYLHFDDDIAEDSVTCEFLGSEGTLSTAALGASDFAIGRDVNGNSCMGGAQRSESFQPLLGDDTAFVQIPLV
jgi:hypothetical protein